MTTANTTITSKAAWSRQDQAAFLLAATLTVARLFLGAALGLAQDEAHYWQWSRHLDFSYYDQGPGIALCIRLGTLLFGDTPFGIRVVNTLLTAGTGWLAYRTAARWTNSQVGLWAMVFLSVAPLLAVGGVLATYDSVQVFFWAAALYALTHTLQQEHAAGWYVVGALVGMGSLCKVTMLLFAPCVLLFLLLSPTYRKWLATPHPYAAFTLALLLFTPVAFWNARHDWVNLRHAAALTSRSRGAPPFRWFGEFLGGQAFALGPFLFLAELFVLIRFTRRTPGIPDEARRFFGAFGAPILALCLLMSLRSKLEINWPVPAHLAGLMAVAAWLHLALPTRFRTGLAAGFTVPALLMSGAVFVPDVLPLIGVRSPVTAQKPLEPYGWSEIAARVQQERVSLERKGKPVFLAGTNYRVNSILGFYLPDRPEMVALYLGTRRDQFGIWSRPQEHVGENAILVLSEKDDEAERLARQVFTRVEGAPSAVVTRPGFIGPIKDWRIFRGYGFRGYDPDRFADGY
ncbi:MAG: glycosyltransferase family 39 protein [Cytophagales bacterium]|nr:glycosyltransferase family 39 protein [Armatimonadota bacterium]